MLLVPVEQLLAKLVRTYPFREEPNEADVVEWAREVYRLIDAYDIWERKKLVVTINDHRAYLPNDFHSLDFKATDTRLRIQGREAYFSAKTGTATIYYLAFPIDDRFYPLIPDNAVVLDAFMFYCAARCYGNETLLETQRKNEDTEHEKWLQKKLEARAEINGMRIGQEIQRVADNYGSFIAHRKQPRFNG